MKPKLTVAQWHDAIIGQETKEDREAMFRLWHEDMVARAAAFYKEIHADDSKDSLQAPKDVL